MKKKSPGPVNMGSVLANALKSLSQPQILDFVRIDGLWEEIVGRRLWRVSRPAELRRGTLTIWVTEPVWVDSMMYMKSRIISQVNEAMGQHTVSGLKIVQKSGIFRPAPGEPEKEEDQPPLDMGPDEEIDPALDGIDDSQLRSTFKRVILKDKGLKSKRPRH